MIQQAEKCDWSEIMRLVRTGNVHERRSALVEAQLQFEQFFEDEGLSLVKGDSRESLAILVERGIITEAAELLRLQNAFRIRNQVIHKKIDVPPEEIQAAVLAFKVFIFRRNGMYQLLKDEPQVIAEHIHLPVSDTRLPPPPNISFHPDFYVPRGLSAKRVLNSLLHPNTPVVVQAPPLFGKRALVGRVLQELSQQENGTIVRIDCAKIETHDDFFNQFPSDIVAKSIVGHIVQGTLNHILRSRDGLFFLVIEQADLLSSKVRTLLETLRKVSVLKEEPWRRLRLLFTASATFTELKKSGNFPVENCISIEEFNRVEVEQLAALHKFSKEDIEDVWRLVGGHPYLVRVAFYEAFMQGILPSEIVLRASVFSEHLEMLEKFIRRKYLVSGGSLELRKSFQEAMTPFNAIGSMHDSLIAVTLYKQGILSCENGNFKPRCLLYGDLLARIITENNSFIQAKSTK